MDIQYSAIKAVLLRISNKKMKMNDSVCSFITMLRHVKHTTNINIIIFTFFLLKIYHLFLSPFLEFNSVKNLSGLNVLEVGSGRGGGLSYISNYLSPANCIGVDFSENQVRFCKSHYAGNEKL